MKKIQLKDPSVIEFIEEAIDKINSIVWAIQKLSIKGIKMDECLWDIIKKEYPEIKDYQCSYNDKKKEIIMLYKLEEK